MKYVPHDYQRYVTNYIETHPACAVLLDMGLGKTSITLTALLDLLFDTFEAHRILVIAPLRVARDTWPAEIEKWDHLKLLTYSVAVGSEKDRIAALKRPADIYIINRENVQWLVEQSGIPFDFDTVIVDELSSFKSHQSKRFKALMRVRPRIKRIVGLTGTPSMYRNNYFTPDKRNGQIIYSYKLLPGADKAIYKRISDITISMKAADHLKMPELIMNNCVVDLSDDERERYEELRATLVLQLPEKEITVANAAALTGKLLQMANGAIYDDDKQQIRIHDRKLDALEDLIEGANGKPVLVAYWFKHDLERIKSRFKVREIKTSADIRDWNAGIIPVAVIHPASAGHGLNLQAGGSTLIWFGLTWSLELYQQTNARLWRQGQSETVVIHHIITDDTVDGRVLKALQNKEKTQDGLIAAVKAELYR